MHMYESNKNRSSLGWTNGHAENPSDNTTLKIQDKVATSVLVDHSLYFTVMFELYCAEVMPNSIQWFYCLPQDPKNV